MSRSVAACVAALALVACGGDEGDAGDGPDRADVERSVRAIYDECANVALGTGGQKQQAVDDVRAEIDELIRAYEEDPDLLAGAGIGDESPRQAMEEVSAVLRLCSPREAERIDRAIGDQP